jgi:hypothetical protein
MIVQPYKIERSADPGDSDNQMCPAAQQIQPFQNKSFHYNNANVINEIFKPLRSGVL